MKEKAARPDRRVSSFNSNPPQKGKKKSCKETEFFTRALETRSLSSVSSQRKTAARREPATGKRSISLLEPIQVKVVSCC